MLTNKLDKHIRVNNLLEQLTASHK